MTKPCTEGRAAHRGFWCHTQARVCAASGGIGAGQDSGQGPHPRGGGKRTTTIWYTPDVLESGCSKPPQRTPAVYSYKEEESLWPAT
eukprot:7381401-Prymnesium_polylepis.1